MNSHAGKKANVMAVNTRTHVIGSRRSAAGSSMNGASST
jgi:hypothetical protein